MPHSHPIWVLALAVSAAVCVSTNAVATDGLTVTDKKITISGPVLPSSLPVQMGSSLNTQYAALRSPDPAAGTLRLETLTVEEGVRYPAFWGDVYSGSSVGEKLMPSGRDSFALLNPNNAYLTSWLNKQWASVDLSLAQVHRIEKSEDQLAVGVSKSVSVLHDAMFLSVGECWFDDLSNRYWSRTMDLALGYRWKHWDFSMFIEQRQDPSLSAQSVWAAIKTKF